MKNLRLLFAGLVLIASFVACSPNHDEEVKPDSNEQSEQIFKTRNTEGGTVGRPSGK